MTSTWGDSYEVYDQAEAKPQRGRSAILREIYLWETLARSRQPAERRDHQEAQMIPEMKPIIIAGWIAFFFMLLFVLPYIYYHERILKKLMKEAKERLK